MTTPDLNGPDPAEFPSPTGVSREPPVERAGAGGEPAHRCPRREIIGAFLYAVVFGAEVAFLPEDTWSSDIVSTLLVLPFLFLLFSWCYRDAYARGHFLSRGMKIALVLVAGLAFPVYLFQTRGAKGGLRALGRSLLLFAGVIAISVLSALLLSIIASLLGIEVPE